VRLEGAEALEPAEAGVEAAVEAAGAAGQATGDLLQFNNTNK